MMSMQSVFTVTAVISANALLDMMEMGTHVQVI